MGKSLHLMLPEEDWTEEMVNEYISHKTDVVTQFTERDESELRRHFVVEVYRDRVSKDQDPMLGEELYDDVLESLTADELAEIFEFDGVSYNRLRFEGDLLAQLEAAFEDAIPRFAERNPQLDAGLMMGQYIALCRFARKRGYTLRLSY
jgi:hypothetical protein